jgi:hypothetical protein
MEKMPQQPLGKKYTAVRVEKPMDIYRRCGELQWNSRH